MSLDFGYVRKGKKAPLRKTMMEMMALGKTVVKADMMVKMVVMMALVMMAVVTVVIQ